MKPPRCQNCDLLLSHCICSRLSPTSLPPGGRLRQLVVLLHQKEWRRASNTGKLLPLCLPNDATILLEGLPDTDRWLSSLFLRQKEKMTEKTTTTQTRDSTTIRATSGTATTKATPATAAPSITTATTLRKESATSHSEAEREKNSARNNM